MKFEEALKELRNGKKISCISLPSLEFSLSPQYELSIKLPNNLSKFSIIDFIIKGEWYVLEEPGKSFPEVFESFKQGKKIKRKCLSIDSYLTKNDCYYNLNAKDLLATDWIIVEE